MKGIYHKEIYIPFQLADTAGILFYGHVFSLAHEVYEHFIQDKLQLPWDSWFKNPEWIVPIKQTQASYYAPMKAGIKYQVNLEVLGITNSSFSLKFRFVNDNHEHCSVETVHVFCDRSSKNKQPIPPTIKATLQNLFRPA